MLKINLIALIFITYLVKTIVNLFINWKKGNFIFSKDKIFEQFKFAREERSKILGENQSKEIEKRILLQSIDFNWKSHIQYLEQLRQVVGLRSYGQRDPLIEYKKEAFDLFSNLLDKLKLDYVKILMNLKVYNEPTEKINQRQLKEKFRNLPKADSCSEQKIWAFVDES